MSFLARIAIAAVLVILAAFLLSAQTKPLTCSEMIGDLYIQVAQAQQQQQARITELTQQLATAQAELTKLKGEAK